MRGVEYTEKTLQEIMLSPRVSGAYVGMYEVVSLNPHWSCILILYVTPVSMPVNNLAGKV